MSKASDWAKQMTDAQAATDAAIAANPGPWSVRLGEVQVVRESYLVGSGVEMLIDLTPCSGKVQLRKDEAIAFANWILETFGEKP